MTARAAFVLAASAVVACAQIVGIGDFAGAPDAGTDAPQSDVVNDAPPATSCTNAIITSSNNVDAISVAGAFVFTQWFENEVDRCPVGTKCSNPSAAFSVGVDEAFEYAAFGGSIVYSTTDNAGGTIHRVDLAGVNDVTLVTTAANPSFVAVGDAQHTYWVDDEQPAAAVHCVECAGSDSVWIDGIDQPAALFADGASVYVLALDQTGVTAGVFGCAAGKACGTSPRTVIEGLPAESLGPTNVTSDGARVFVPRIPFADVASVDSTGNVKPLVTGVNATALAVDAASGELFYGTSDGRVGRVKSDGSIASTTLSDCQSSIVAIAFDATNLYVLVTDFQIWTVFSIAR